MLFFKVPALALVALTPFSARAASLIPRSSPLTHRAETTTVYLVDGQYTPYESGYLAGTWELFSNGQYCTLEGVGYLRVRWEVESKHLLHISICDASIMGYDGAAEYGRDVSKAGEYLQAVGGTGLSRRLGQRWTCHDWPGV